MVFACKKCKKAFRKDMRLVYRKNELFRKKKVIFFLWYLFIYLYSDYEEEDEYCPHCDNHYVLEAVTPEPKVGIETGDLRVDSR